MSLTKLAFALLFFAACVGVALWNNRRRKRLFFESHSIDPEQLHAMLFAGGRADAVQVIDVREPLDLLAYSVAIPGSRRIAPREILENPDLIAKDREAVVYCTCLSDETSIKIMRKAVSLGFDKIKFLHGGLEAWRRNSYPVEPYNQAFRLDTPA